MITHIFSMKTVSKIGLGAMLIATLSGCKEFKGKINVTQAFGVKVVKGKNVVPVGQHSVKVDFPERGKARIEVSLPGKNSNPRFYIKLPRHGGLNQQNGPISIKAEESGQPFDIVGDIQTDQYNSALIRELVSCTYTDTIRECTTDVNNIRTCRDLRVTKTGEKRVEYYNRYTTQKINLLLLNIAAEQQLASLNGTYQDTEKIVTREGRCRDRFGGGGHHGGWDRDGRGGHGDFDGGIDFN